MVVRVRLCAAVKASEGGAKLLDGTCCRESNVQLGPDASMRSSVCGAVVEREQ